MSIGRNGRNPARTKSAISSSLRQGRWSRAKTNSVSMREREARNCGLPKNWDEPFKATQSGGGSFAGALDCDHCSAGGGGTFYFYLTLQLHRLGDRKKSLETELVGLRTQNDVANVQIAALTSRSALQRRLKEGYLKMIPIAEQNIVRLAPIRPAPEENTIRPVANDQVGR